MPGELTAKGKVVGLKQTRRALAQGALCAEKAIPCDSSMTLRQLGTACGIAVPAAAVAVLNG